MLEHTPQPPDWPECPGQWEAWPPRSAKPAGLLCPCCKTYHETTPGTTLAVDHEQQIHGVMQELTSQGQGIGTLSKRRWNAR